MGRTPYVAQKGCGGGCTTGWGPPMARHGLQEVGAAFGDAPVSARRRPGPGATQPAIRRGSKEQYLDPRESTGRFLPGVCSALAFSPGPTFRPRLPTAS